MNRMYCEKQGVQWEKRGALFRRRNIVPVGLWNILRLTEVPLGHLVVLRYTHMLYKQMISSGTEVTWRSVYEILRDWSKQICCGIEVT